MPRDWDSIVEKPAAPKTTKSTYVKVPTLTQVMTQVDKLCVLKCGRVPKSVIDCVGYDPTKYPKYSCNIRLLSDDICWALEMGWDEVVKGHFAELLNLRR